MGDTQPVDDQQGALEEELSEEEKKSIDPALFTLYKSRRPPVALCEGVPLSAIINATWLQSDAKVGAEGQA